MEVQTDSTHSTDTVPIDSVVLEIMTQRDSFTADADNLFR